MRQKEEDTTTPGNPARVRLVQGLKRQLSELNQEIDRLKKHRQEVNDAEEILGQIEATLHRMSILAHTAAKADSEQREYLSAAFESCKKQVEALSDKAVLNGHNLMRESGEQIRAVIAELTDSIK